MQAYFVTSDWRVDQMVDHLNCSYLYKKCGVYYFSKRVPNDVKQYYKNDRIFIFLKTKSNISAIHLLNILKSLLWIMIKSTMLPHEFGTKRS